MKDIAKMMGQVQKIKQDMERAQNETEVCFSANGVEVVARGDFSISSIVIREDLIEEKDVELIQDLVQIAVNGALEGVRKKLESSLGGMAGGLGLSGLMG